MLAHNPQGRDSLPPLQLSPDRLSAPQLPQLTLRTANAPATMQPLSLRSTAGAEQSEQLSIEDELFALGIEHLPAEDERASRTSRVIQAVRSLSPVMGIKLLFSRSEAHNDEAPVEAVQAESEAEAPSELPVTVLAPAAVKPARSAATVTVRRIAQTEPVSVASTSVAAANHSVATPAARETNRQRERYSASSALLVGGLALLGAKAYSKQRFAAIKGFRPSLSLESARAKVAELRMPNWRDAPLQAYTRTKTRLMELNETGHNHKGALAGAIGAVLFAGVAYAAYKNWHHSSGSSLAGSEHATGANPPVNGPNGSHNAVTVTPPKHAPQVAGGADLHHALPAHPEVAAQGDIAVVHKGDGFTNVIDSYAKQHHVQLTGSQNYQLYQQLHAQFGDNILNADTYRLPNGDLGLRRSGNTTWNPQAQAVLEGFLKAAKKKKTLS